MSLDPATQTALQAIALAVMIFGLFSLFIPILPGMAIIWVPTLVYGILTGFNWASGILFALITGLMLFGSVADNFIMGQQARQTGASWLAIAVSLIAGVVGSIVFPPFGGLIAALIGLFVVEMFRLQDLKRALSSTKSMAIGCGWATVIRFFVGLVMIALFLVWIYWT
ncbi:MAG: DUF456 domain-containing protein [Chloroflexi bacterium]|nr:MAG: DUF456 domain-containing protein [Chloroflexota bacterium]